MNTHQLTCEMLNPSMSLRKVGRKVKSISIPHANEVKAATRAQTGKLFTISFHGFLSSFVT